MTAARQADAFERDLAAIRPVAIARRRWPAILGGIVSVAMVAMLAHELFGSGLAGLSRAAPDSPWFYIVFVALYLSVPAGDFIIFRRLWNIPAAGFGALARKRIASEVVVDYSGEAYFYAWARTHARRLIAAPFGAIKDVSILSAVAGNVVTLALCLAAWPAGHRLLSPESATAVLWSVAAMLAGSFLVLLLSRRVFSLARPALVEILAIHCLRILVGVALLAWCWDLAMPQVPGAVWLIAAAGRLLVARLPLVPNKELLFAGLTIATIGADQPLSETIAFTAALTLVAHVALVAIFALGMARGAWRRRRAG